MADPRIEQIINDGAGHEISAGPVNFDEIRLESKDLVTVQVFYEDLDTDDVEIKLQQNLEHGNPNGSNDIVDNRKKSVSVKLKKDDKSHTFNISGWATDKARVILSSIGTATTGKITKILWYKS